MRWFWIDRFVEFVSGQHARAIKNVSLAEEHLHDHFPGASFMPNSLVAEGIAQTGGILVGDVYGFDMRVVLAKIAKAEFHFHAMPGDTLTYTAKIDDIQADGARVSATSQVGDRLQADVELMFAHLDERHANRELFDPADFLVTLRTLGLYDVGVKPDGSKLEVPKRLLDAERARNG
jgi:3-hydroxyacyl-[acyl-carrier-protein] dehydratase